MSDIEKSESYLAFEAWCRTPLGRKTVNPSFHKAAYRIWLAAWNAKTMADDQQWSLNQRRGT